MSANLYNAWGDFFFFTFASKWPKWLLQTLHYLLIFCCFSCIREIVMAKCVSLIVVVHVATILATVFKFVPQAGKRFSSPIKTLQTLFKSTYKY